MTAIELAIEAAKEAESLEQAPIFVRIKPRNERKGIRMRRYRVFGMQFVEATGWYKVSRFVTAEVSGREQLVDTKEYFSNVRNTDNEDSPLAFDVCTEAEARAIDEAERKAAEPKRKSADPVDLTTADVRPARMQVTEQTPARRPGRPRKPRGETPPAAGAA